MVFNIVNLGLYLVVFLNYNCCHVLPSLNKVATYLPTYLPISLQANKGLKRVTRVQCSWIFTFTIFGNLSEGYPFSAKWLPRDLHAVVLTPEFCISRLKINRWKTKCRERKLKRCSAFFLRRKGSFSSRNRSLRNSTLFSSRRSPWFVLKCN